MAGEPSTSATIAPDPEANPSSLEKGGIEPQEIDKATKRTNPKKIHLEEKAVVLSFRALQLRRIEALQDDILRLDNTISINTREENGKDDTLQCAFPKRSNFPSILSIGFSSQSDHSFTFKPLKPNAASSSPLEPPSTAESRTIEENIDDLLNKYGK